MRRLERLPHGRLALLLTGMLLLCAGAEAAEIPRIGSRLEPFVDQHLVEALEGAVHELHEPLPAGTAIAFDLPWEGLFCAYVTVLQDDSLYRMYYRGYPDLGAEQVTCYAESTDGVHWTKPRLGLFEIAGTLDNNVILREHVAPGVTHNFAPFLDRRPGVPPSQRYKAIGGGSGGLYGLVSPDGIHFSLVRGTPIITGGAFDSLNVAFWSQAERAYVCYYRTFNGGYRSVSRKTSQDFLNWSAGVLMQHDAPLEHLYTNATHPYFRAPHIYLALPARFMPGLRVITDPQALSLGIDPASFLVKDISEGCFMTTRGGDRYDRTFREGFPRPGPGYGNWVSRTNYPACGVVPTGPHEMSMYVRRNYGQATARMERLTLRTDGFASIRGPFAGGRMTTRPFVFTGQDLVINYSTSAAGGIRVELLDVSGSPIPGFSLAEADEIVGDEIDRVVSWGGRKDVSALSGLAVRLRVELKDADLFSFQFRAPVSTPLPPDFDGDEDVDQSDFGFLQRCYSERFTVLIAPGCEPADLTGDGWIDAADLAAFRKCAAGAVNEPLTGCRE